MNKFGKMLGRVLSTLLIFSMVLNSVPANASGYTAYEVKQLSYTNLNKYANIGTLTQSQVSLFNSLSSISRLFLWTNYIHNVSSAITTFSKSEKTHYYNILKTKIESFNDTFSKESELYKNLSLTVPKSDMSIQSMNTLVKEVSAYVETFYKEHYTFIKDKESDSEKIEYYSNNKVILNACYEIMLRFQQDYSFIRTLLPYQDVTKKYVIDISPMSSILSHNDYKFFIDSAISQLENEINSSYSIELSEGNDVLSKFSSVLGDGDESLDAVNTAYLSAFSASSLYMPLESKIGDTNVVESIKYLCGNNTEVSDLYNQVARKKKPLYLRNYSKGSVAGAGELAVLGDIIEMIIEGKKGALVSVEGSFQSSEDGNSYQTSDKSFVNRVDEGVSAGTYETTTTVTEEEDTDGNKTTTTVTENSAYEKLEGDEGNITALESSLGEGTNFTEPVLVFGDTLRGETNTAVITNYYLNRLDLDGELARSGVLYVNPFGDIILADNTVIVPAAANATYYTDDDGIVYNPFTEMFMEGYPRIGKQTTFNLITDKDDEKVLFSTSKDMSEDKIMTSAVVKLDGWSSGDTVGFYVSSNGTLKNSVFNKLKLMPIDNGLYDPSSATKFSIFNPEEKDFSGWFSFIDNNITQNRYFYRMDYSTLTVSGLNAPIFPYGNSEGEEALIRSKFLVQSFYYSITMTEEGDNSSGNGRLDLRYLHKILSCGLDGMINVNGFQKIAQQDLLDETSKGWFYSVVKIIRDACDSVVDLFGDAPGLLGIRSANQDPIMGKFLYCAKLSMVYIFIFLAFMFVANYIRRSLNINYTVIGIIAACLLAYSCVYFFPRHLSTVTNFLPGNKSNELAYNSLLMRQETNMGVIPKDASYGDFGSFSLSNSSINIYKLRDEEIQDICVEYDVDYGKIVAGGAIELDEEYGLFLEGDSLKISLDKFFHTVTIQGYTSSLSNKATYKLSYNKNVSSVVDYYMPYFVILEGLVEKLNTLSEIYEIPKAQLTYSGNLRKDSFLMDAYIHSPVFLSPEDYKKSDDSMSDILYDQLSASSAFGPNNVDFLGLHNSLSKYLEDFNSSLWVQTMHQNGYLSDTEASGNKYSHLIEYVNLQVKKFLMDNSSSFAFVSDETILEVTALYAVMVFNNQVSEFGNVLYPQSLNYEDLTVVDTIRSVVTKDYNKFASLGRDILDYVYYEFGWVGVVGTTLAIVFASLLSLIVNYSVYILYLLLLIFTLLRFILAKQVSEALKGFLKIFGALILIYFVNIYGTLLINNLSDSGLSILFLMILNCACLGLALAMLSFVITGFGTLDFGSTKVDSFLRGMKDFVNPFSNNKPNISAETISSKKISNEEDTLDYDFTLSAKDRSYINQAVIDNFMNERYNNSNPNVNRDYNRKFSRRRTSTSINSYEDDEEDDLLM